MAIVVILNFCLFVSFSARVEELDYVTPVIIVVSCLATVAGPAAAIFIYIFRKMKINGSYSLADSLKPNI